MVRTPCRDEYGRKKGTWTPEEDRKLAAYVTKNGCLNWRQLPKHAGLARCGKSCRLRWMNYLRPNVKRGNYTNEEDGIILKLHTQLGNRWSAIAAHLPGRSDNDIKNHWHTSLKKRANYESSKKYNKNRESTNTKNQASSRRKSTVENENASSLSCSMSTHETILEGSQWSLKQSSSEEISSCTADYQQLDIASDIREVKVFEEEAYVAESCGSFWTEPFVVDSFSSRLHDCVAPSIDFELVSPPSPFIGHGFISSFNLDDYLMLSSLFD